MILGEHAVVYGYNCISTEVNKFLTVEIEESEGDRIVTPGVVDQTLIKFILNDLRTRLKTDKKLSLKITSELIGLGLGSSSAVIVGLTRAVYEYSGIFTVKGELFETCLKYLRKFQPLASGYDLANVIYGGTVLYNGKSRRTEIISHKVLPMLIAFTGRKAYTPTMVGKVALLKKEKPDEVNKIFISIDGIVKKGVLAVKSANWSKLGELMNQNHRFLVQLNVSTPQIDRMVEISRRAGAYGAKLSGAGGGDCIIVLTQNKDKIKKAVIREGGTIIDY